MSDPTSVAGTAVGVASLGLQVCDKIVSYCQAWRGFDRDIQTLSQKADGLRIPLQWLRGLLANFQAIDIAISKDIEEKLQQIEEVSKRLKEAIAQFASKGSGNTAAIRAQFKKATYPFRKDGLRDMSSDLDSLHLSLHTVLHALSIQHAQILITMQQATAQNIHHMNSSIEDIRKQFVLPSSSRNLCQDHCTRVAVIPEPSLTRPNHRSTHQLHSQINFKRHNKNTTKAYSHSVRMLRLAINFTLSVTIGTAGLSIAPSLRLQPLRDGRSSRVLETLQTFANETRRKFPNDMEDLVTATIMQIQEIFDRGEATPSDIYINSYLTAQEISILDYTCMGLGYGSFIASSRLLQFLVDCGASPARIDGPDTPYISMLLSLTGLLQGEHQIGGHLFDLYGSNLQPPGSLAQKEGFRWFIRQNHDNINIPDIAKAIMRESESDLKEAMKAKSFLINDRIGACSLLDIAFGWPRGIQILLEAGADAHDYAIRFVEDTESKITYDSVKILLQAGCKFSFVDIEQCNQVPNGGNIRSLLIGELIKRLKGLWKLAKCHLPSEEIPALFMNRDGDSKNLVIFDVWTTQIHSRLTQNGTIIDSSLRTPHFNPWSSVYHYPLFSVQTLQVLYDFGFRGVNEPDQDGMLPLISHGRGLRYLGQEVARQVMDRISWLISKGADPNRPVPGTCSTVAHNLTYWIFGFIDNAFWSPTEPPWLFLKEWNRWKAMILERTKSFAITPSSADECICACSPSGCNTISLLLRQAFKCLYYRPSDSHEDLGFWLRETVAFVLIWIGESRKVCQEIIRFFTFDALSLTHVCCVDEWNRHFCCSRLQTRNRREVEEILDEEKLGVGNLEKLVAEVNEKFDELGFPIIVFLQGHWYSRIVEFLSERDPYDEEHHVELGKIGVKLEAEEWVLPDRVALLIRPNVEEIVDA